MTGKEPENKQPQSITVEEHQKALILDRFATFLSLSSNIS